MRDLAELWYKDTDNIWKPLMVDYSTFQCQAKATNYESTVYFADGSWSAMDLDCSQIKLFNPAISSVKEEAYELTETNIYIKESGLYSISFNFDITEAVYKDPIDYPGSVYPSGTRTLSMTILNNVAINLSKPTWNYREHRQTTTTASYTNENLLIESPTYLISDFSGTLTGFGSWGGAANYTALSNCSCTIKRLA